MEKNENEELLEQSPAEIQQEDTQKIAKSGKNRKSPVEDLYSGVWREYICCIQVTASVRDM